jgi:hypothetical protein
VSLQEFDALMERMQQAFGYATNLGQYTDAAKILYQINDQLPDDLQMNLELEDKNAIRSFISEYEPKIKSAIIEYKQRLRNF